MSLLMAECNHHQDLRGIARLREGEEQTRGQGLGELVGQGVMAITIEPERGERYQGLVPMESPSLAGCLQAYFEQSEQLKTRLWFAVDEQACTGLMLQALPGSERADPEQNRNHLETLSTLAGTVTTEELLSLEHAPLLYRLFNEYPLRLFDSTPLRFACHCSRERSAGALLSLGRDEVEQLLVEQGGIDIDCQFCNQHYHFDAADVRQLLGDTTLH